ncbi:unnamed protein product, partial [Dracunculus medinensis]|uniref:Mitochondrial inner membrane protein OXA1 n=1 Tax=Dracunculus medinensis TaxID=318479 RepID=A0A0N4UAL5_DRAME
NFPDIPAIPAPPPPKLSIEELAEAGESVLSELGLFSWWKPTSYVRLLLEYSHICFDIPWWATIVATTVGLRLALIYVPIMSQRLVAQRSIYANEFADFQNRITEAQKEGDTLLVQQVLLEQRDFCLAKGIRNGRMIVVLLANAFAFTIQFFSIKKMIAANYPGWSSGGALWFPDLTVSDPYYALPLISAVTIFLVVNSGIEFGASSEQVSPVIGLGMKYGIPILVLICTSQFASGLCLYWCTSNLMSLLYAGVFRIPAVRNFLEIPKVVAQPLQSEGQRKKRAAPPSLYDLTKEDLKQFKKAGRIKKD